MFGIIVNHLALYPNLLAVFTGATKLWVSMAEGFFMVSGFFIGYLYKEKIKHSFKEVFKKLSLRSLRLYLWTVYLTILFTYWGNLMPIGSVKESLWIVKQSNLLEFVSKVITYRYTYGWADLLPIYSIFLIISPFYLWSLSKGYWKFLLLVNILVWIFRSESIYLSIQILFFMATIVGFYYDKVALYWKKMETKKQLKLVRAINWSFLLSFVACLFSVFLFNKLVKNTPLADYFIAKNKVLNWYFDKQTVGLGRLILSPLWFLSGLFIFTSLEKQIKRYLGWLLLVFGKNSLYAYILHAFIIYPIPFLVQFYNIGGVWWNTTITVLAVSLIYLFLYFSSEAFKRRF